MFEDNEFGEVGWKCFQCSRVVPIEQVQFEKPNTEELKVREAFERENYWEKHREEILADRLVMLGKEWLKKWGLEYKEWARLRRRWRSVRGVRIPDLRGRKIINKPVEVVAVGLVGGKG